MMGDGARDLPTVGGVEVELGRSSFDGNHTSNTASWLIGASINLGLNENDLSILMDWVERGHLAWVVIPVPEHTRAAFGK